MLHQNYVIVVGLNAPDHLCHLDSLLHIKIRSWLIENVNACLLNKYDHHGESLKFPSRKFRNVSLVKLTQFKGVLEVFRHFQNILLLNVFSHLSFYFLCNSVDVLRLYCCLEIFFKHTSEIILEF